MILTINKEIFLAGNVYQVIDEDNNTEHGNPFISPQIRF